MNYNDLIPPSNPEFPWVADNWQMLCYYCNQPIFIEKEGKLSAMYRQRGNGGMGWRHANKEWACKKENLRTDIDTPRCHICGTQTNEHEPFCSAAGFPPYHATTMTQKEDEVESWHEIERNKDMLNAIFSARCLVTGHDVTVEQLVDALDNIIAASPWGAIREAERT